MKEEVEGEYGGMPIRLDMVRVRQAKEVKIKDRRIEELVRKLELNHMIIIYMTIEIFIIKERNEAQVAREIEVREYIFPFISIKG